MAIVFTEPAKRRLMRETKSLVGHDRGTNEIGGLSATRQEHTVATVRDFLSVQVEVKGKLAALIGGGAFPQAVCSGGRAVAGEGFEPPTYGL